MPAVVDTVQNRLVAMEQHYTRRIGLPAINVVKADSFAFKNRPTGGFLLSAMLENHVANDHSDQKNGYSNYKDAFGL
jgi:hypothetical protein